MSGNINGRINSKMQEWRSKALLIFYVLVGKNNENRFISIDFIKVNASPFGENF